VMHSVIEAVPGATEPDQQTMPEFDLDDIRTHGFLAKLTERLLEDPRWLMTPLRRFFPIVKLPLVNAFVVTCYDDVQELLSQDRVFDVPWKPYVLDLNGAHFLLSMDANEPYQQTQRRIMKVFRHDDVARTVTPLSAGYAEGIISASEGRLEAIENLISRVPVRICEDYFGVRIADDGVDAARCDEQRRDFAHWLIAMSTFTFGNPRDDSRYRKAAMAAGRRVHELVERRIREAKANPSGNDTILDRLIQTQDGPEPVEDRTIRGWLVSMMTGFVPTCTLASGRALEILMRNQDFREQCQAAARKGDDDLLQRCIRETMRFMPIFLGHQRICRRNYVLAQGTPRAKEIPAGEHVLASTWSAMFDPTRIVNPNVFDPTRPASNYMLFGFGVHSCVGVVIAEAQILQTMKALLKCPNLRRARGRKGRMEWLGQFPGRLWVQFDAKPSPVV
jgi:cytochrome P450